MRYMQRKHPMGTLVAVLLVATAVVVPGVAWGAAPPPDTPLITDRAGDTGYCLNIVTTDGRSPLCDGQLHRSAPAIDIMSGDISLRSASLDFETTVVDLDDPVTSPDDILQFAMTAVTGNVRLRVEATRSSRFEPPYATFVVTNTTAARSLSGPATVAFDARTNTIRWTVGLAAVNAAVVHVCPQCREWRRGTTLTGITAEAYQRRAAIVSLQESDRAQASRNYAIGDD